MEEEEYLNSRLLSNDTSVNHYYTNSNIIVNLLLLTENLNIGENLLNLQNNNVTLKFSQESTKNINNASFKLDNLPIKINNYSNIIVDHLSSLPSLVKEKYSELSQENHNLLFRGEQQIRKEDNKIVKIDNISNEGKGKAQKQPLGNTLSIIEDLSQSELQYLYAFKFSLNANFDYRVSINDLREDGQPLLTKAIKEVKLRKVKDFFVSPMINIDAGTFILADRCFPTFLLAIKMNNIKIVEAFLKLHEKTIILQENQDNKTDLIIAAQSINIDVFIFLTNYLITHWQNIFDNDIEKLISYLNHQDKEYHSTLFYALYNNLTGTLDNIAIVKNLITLQVDNKGQLISEQEQKIMYTMILKFFGKNKAPKEDDKEINKDPV